MPTAHEMKRRIFARQNIAISGQETDDTGQEVPRANQSTLFEVTRPPVPPQPNASYALDYRLCQHSFTYQAIKVDLSIKDLVSDKKGTNEEIEILGLVPNRPRQQFCHI